MDDLVGIVVPVACGCVLPIVVIWLSVREKMNETNKRTQIALAAIEKNPELDLEDLLRKISPKQKLLKEKLLRKLLWGCLTSMMGLGLIGFGVFLGIKNMGGDDDPLTSVCFGLMLLAIGIAFLISYFVGRKLLAREMEAEERNVVEKTKL